jgi:hypothetical protein
MNDKITSHVTLYIYIYIYIMIICLFLFSILFHLRYRNGSILRDHLDVLETHVISGILHIDHDTDEPYEINIEDAKGQLASYDLQVSTPYMNT